MSDRVTVKHIDASISISDRKDHTLIITDADDVVITLPKADHSTLGQLVSVVQQNVSAGTGIAVKPQATDVIRGQTIAGVALAGAAGKKLINTGATDVLGDRVTLCSDGDGTWYIIGLQGIWAAEA